MLLLIDAGNTRVKWALVDEGAPPGVWRASGALLHAELDTLTTVLQQHQPQRAWLSNVAGAALRIRLESLLITGGLAQQAQRWFRSSAQQAGVINGYRDPSQLGCDRFASMMGARALFPGQALIVVTAGTATTIDALDATGHFLGGMILPGLATMAQSLALNTAQLPQVEARWLDACFADNTPDAIASGCIQAQVGAILRARQQLPAAGCVLSGGAAEYLLPLVPPPVEQVEHLVLRGLQVAALSES
jgi:type III pantothenate kinase